MLKSALTFACLLIVGGALPAQAKPAIDSDGGLFFKPYVGADYQYTRYGTRDASSSGVPSTNKDFLDTSLHGVNVHAGARVHQNLGVELGYFQTEKSENSNVLGLGFNSKGRYWGTTLDVLGYYPVAQDIEFIGTVGVSHARTHFAGSAVANGEANENEWRPRIGAGAQYWFSDHVNGRALLRWQGANFDNTVGNAVVGTVGLNYQF